MYLLSGVMDLIRQDKIIFSKAKWLDDHVKVEPKDPRALQAFESLKQRVRDGESLPLELDVN